MNNKWVSFLPHLKSKVSTNKIYIAMIVLLCPMIAASVLSTTSLMPLVTILVSVITAFLTDLIFKLIVEKRYDFSEVSALFIGLIIGVCMPTGAGWWVPILSTIFSVVFIRDIAGGIGQNFVSEIAVSVLLSQLLFTADFYLFRLSSGAIVSESLLDLILSGQVDSINIGNLLFGGYAGSIAETSQFWLILAGIICMVFKIVDFRVSLSLILSTFIFSILFFNVTSAVNLLFAGWVMVGAFFIATDYAVVPKNKRLRYLYGVLIGFFTVLIWKFGNYHMAVFYAILIMGLLSSMFNGLSRILKNRRV